MSQSTARDQFKKLVSKGYLVQINGNGYEFFETSQTRVAPIQQQIAAADSNDATAHNFEERASVVKLESGNREIYNKYEKNIINKSVDKNLGVNPVDKKEFKF